MNTPDTEAVVDLIRQIEREFQALEDLPAWIRKMQDQLREARAAVPREPTEAMLAAVRKKPHPTRPDGWDAANAQLWRHMWDAATSGVALPARGNTTCNPHPDAPHGFNRNASHNAGRYVCECEGWMPPGVSGTRDQTKSCQTPMEPPKP